jgi:5-methylcytosine-specific restriction protein B
MAFDLDESLWDEFLQVWPLHRLRNMSLEEYTKAGSQDTFTYWLEFKLRGYGSIAGGSSFKFAIFSRKDQTPRSGDTSLAYDQNYGWYRRFGGTPQQAFEKIRGHVADVAEAASTGRLRDVDTSPLGDAYRWKIAFHYQDRKTPTIPCIFLRKPVLHALAQSESDNSTPQSELYRALTVHRKPDEPIVAFSQRVWKDWIASRPFVVKLTAGAVRNGYVNVDLASAPFPSSMYGGATDAEPGEEATFITDSGEEFTTDIRVGGEGSGRLRRRLGRYFSAVGAKPGDSLAITLDEDGRYRMALTRSPSDENEKSEPTEYKQKSSMTSLDATVPLNQILFGPPGTGKTYVTIEKALAVLDPQLLESVGEERHAPEGRARLKARFDQLAAEGFIEFVTFHQSFSYEDFVEGIRAESEEGKLSYDVADGVFKRLCTAARGASRRQEGKLIDLSGRRIWKISLGASGDENHIYEECIENGYALVGWGGSVDFSKAKSREDVHRLYSAVEKDRTPMDYPVTATYTFAREVKIGDLLIATDGNLKFRAIGVVTGEYEYAPRADDTYAQRRSVEWLRVYETSLPYDALMRKKFTQKTIYELRASSIDQDKLLGLLRTEAPESGRSLPRVLIIDEINRGNVSRIFGELITLIEPTKRAGATEALSVTLPYSKDRFSVPNNLYLIGTMNTADRSLAGLDIALRRRFTFIEMPPAPEKLEGIKIAGVDIAQMLQVMNRRIEVLLDKDHQLGHAYFLGLANGDPIERLASIFRHQILPLLQEYFFDNWEKIAWVLNDHRKERDARFVVPPVQSMDSLFGPGVQVPDDVRLWTINPEAFHKAESYLGIAEADAA